MQHIVIIGATSAMAEHCARLWVQASPVRLTLVGRDLARIQRVADDLRVRSPRSSIGVITTDFLNPLSIQQTVDKIFEHASVNLVLIAHGFLPNQSACQENLNECNSALQINGISPVLFSEAFVKQMITVNSGTVAIIGSVAGDRGRKINYVYGAAKGLVSRYVQGMQQRLINSNVRVLLIKPGPTDTPMTSELRAEGKKMASVEKVARDIVKGIADHQAEIYTPKIWKLIMLIVMHLPKFIFNKTNF